MTGLELFAYAIAAVALALMLYVGLQPEEAVRARRLRREERARERAEDRAKYGGSGSGAGWLLFWLTAGFLILAKFSPTAATVVSICVLMMWLEHLLSRQR